MVTLNFRAACDSNRIHMGECVGNSSAIVIKVDYIDLLTLDLKLPLSNEINSAIIQNHRHVIG